MSKPNFIIPGVARAGTTSLYYYLKQHPDIQFPALKEPKYFSSLNLEFPQQGPGDSTIDQYIVKEREGYFKLFNDLTAKRVGEASPDYLFYHSLTAKAIYKELGDIPIIICLRNPVERAFSAYAYMKRENRENLDFRSALEKEESRLSENYDFMWAYKNYSLYSYKLKSYLDAFSKVKVVLTEQLRDEPESIVKEVLLFLGVDPEIRIDTDVKHNISGTPKNFIARMMLNRQSRLSTYARELSKKLIPRAFLEKSAAKLLQSSSTPEDDFNYLKDCFYDDMVKVNQLIEQEVFDWWKV